VTDHGKKPMATEPLTKKAPLRQHRSDRGASTLGTMQYVTVVAPSTSASIIYTQELSTIQNITPHKDVSSNSFSITLQNVSDAIPQDVLPQSAILVLELVVDVAHDDVRPLEVERTQQESRTIVFQSP
jgi:hypothetical protein